ncbi:MAG: hypothetical protein K8R58_10980 [Bacteroidales bacterium]|nr:hypothetical protein [Bacteroidales bacterium]
MKLKYFIPVFFLICVSLTYAQDTTLTNKYFKLVKTYNSIDEVYLAHPELKPSPPHIVINDDQVLFFDDNREVIKRMPVIKEKELIEEDMNLGENAIGKKINYEYEIVSDKVLIVTTYHQSEQPDIKYPVQRVLYNDRGEYITKIDPHFNITQLSPNNEYILAYCHRTRDKAHIFSYSDGKLISDKLFIGKNTNASFCANSKYIKLKNTNHGIIKIIDVNGLQVFYLNYRENLKSHVFDFFFFEETDKVLVSTFPINMIYLMDLNSRLNWKKEIQVVEKCYLVHNEKELLIHARDEIIDPENYNNYIKLLNVWDGDVLDKILCEEVAIFRTHFFIIKKGGFYYEYEIN